jgi:hypothetical protein
LPGLGLPGSPEIVGEFAPAKTEQRRFQPFTSPALSAAGGERAGERRGHHVRRRGHLSSLAALLKHRAIREHGAWFLSEAAAASSNTSAS